MVCSASVIIDVVIPAIFPLIRRFFVESFRKMLRLANDVVLPSMSDAIRIFASVDVFILAGSVGIAMTATIGKMVNANVRGPL